MSKLYSFSKIDRLCAYVSKKKDFQGVTMENFHELCQAMGVSKPDQMQEKSGRPFQYVKLYNIFRKAKRYLARRKFKINGKNLAEAVYRTQVNPYDLGNGKNFVFPIKKNLLSFFLPATGSDESDSSETGPVDRDGHRTMENTDEEDFYGFSDTEIFNETGVPLNTAVELESLVETTENGGSTLNNLQTCQGTYLYALLQAEMPPQPFYFLLNLNFS